MTCELHIYVNHKNEWIHFNTLTITHSLHCEFYHHTTRQYWHRYKNVEYKCTTVKHTIFKFAGFESGWLQHVENTTGEGYQACIAHLGELHITPITTFVVAVDVLNVSKSPGWKLLIHEAKYLTWGEVDISGIIISLRHVNGARCQKYIPVFEFNKVIPKCCSPFFPRQSCTHSLVIITGQNALWLVIMNTRRTWLKSINNENVS